MRNAESVGDYASMLEPALDLVSRYPKSSLALRRLSDAYYYIGRYEDSLVKCRKAIEMDMNNVRGYDNLAIILSRLGKKDEAVKCFKRGIEIGSKDAKIWLDYASLVADEDKTTALEAVHHAMALLTDSDAVDCESDNYPLLASAGSVLGRLGRRDEALAFAKSTAQNHPDSAEAWFALAAAALRVKQYEEVDVALSRARSIGTLPPTRVLELEAASQRDQGKINAAISLLEQAINIAPQVKRLLIATVELYLKKPVLSYEDRLRLNTHLGTLRGIDAKAAEAYTRKASDKNPTTTTPRTGKESSAPVAKRTDKGAMEVPETATNIWPVDHSKPVLEIYEARFTSLGSETEMPRAETVLPSLLAVWSVQDLILASDNKGVTLGFNERDAKAFGELTRRFNRRYLIAATGDKMEVMHILAPIDDGYLRFDKAEDVDIAEYLRRRFRIGEFALVAPSPATRFPQDAKPVSGERFPSTRLNRLSDQDVSGLTAAQLQYAINEMYARYGADFRDPEIKRWFTQFGWYQPRPGLSYDDTEKLFSYVETMNVKLLGTYRDARRAGVPPTKP
jgi:tetratricopeptide (TPR) repeat protein